MHALPPLRWILSSLSRQFREFSTHILFVPHVLGCAAYQTNYALLLLSLIFFSLTVLADLGNETDLSIYIEDGFKFIGISFWLLYFFDTASMALSVR